MSKKQIRESQPILIIDDSEDDFYAAKRALVKANLYNPIEHATSGDSAIALLQSKTFTRPGLILLDLNMPGTDGRQTLEIIKRDKMLKTIPVVILTTSDDERDIETCYALGANTYIQKPVNFEGLIEAMNRLKGYWFEIAILPKAWETA